MTEDDLPLRGTRYYVYSGDWVLPGRVYLKLDNERNAHDRRVAMRTMVTQSLFGDNCKYRNAVLYSSEGDLDGQRRLDFIEMCSQVDVANASLMWAAMEVRFDTGLEDVTFHPCLESLMQTYLNRRCMVERKRGGRLRILRDDMIVRVFLLPPSGASMCRRMMFNPRYEDELKQRRYVFSEMVFKRGRVLNPGDHFMNPSSRNFGLDLTGHRTHNVKRGDVKRWREWYEAHNYTDKELQGLYVPPSGGGTSVRVRDDGSERTALSDDGEGGEVVPSDVSSGGREEGGQPTSPSDIRA